jgi:hypothetical protein
MNIDFHSLSISYSPYAFWNPHYLYRKISNYVEKIYKISDPEKSYHKGEQMSSKILKKLRKFRLKSIYKIKIGENNVSRVKSNYKVSGRSHAIYHLIVVNKLSGKLSVNIRLFGLMA